MPMAKHSSSLVNTKHPCPCLPGKGYTKLVYCGRPKPWHSQLVGTVTCEGAVSGREGGMERLNGMSAGWYFLCST